MSMGLTSKQRELLLFIRQHFAERGTAPTFDEMAAHLEVASKSGVARLVDALEERGHIRRLPNRARAIELRGPNVPGDDEELRAAIDAGLRAWSASSGVPSSHNTRAAIADHVLAALRGGGRQSGGRSHG